MAFVRSIITLLTTGVLLLANNSQARLGGEHQMLLGNPSGATTDTNNHEHYLIQRGVFALDYNDRNGEPNWVSWNLTVDDLGRVGRSHFYVDPELSGNFYRVKETDYTHSGYDQGHVCPSADRTATKADNARVFIMANIMPQTADNNRGVWEQLESDCREQRFKDMRFLPIISVDVYEKSMANTQYIKESQL
jgi:endonuclease G